MVVLEADDLRAGYGNGPDVLSGAHLEVREGEVVALLGPSGSGKSTLLRCVAGLQPLRAGRILLDGADASGVPVERRGVGLVFQDHALFPHRDVRGNVAFGPRMQGLDPSATEARVTHALAEVGLTALAHRAVDELSGGEQQRVALARALAAAPRLLLLDEPYGSLDRPLRERLAAELPDLVRAAGMGAVLVTHDQQEALRAADRIAVIIDGAVRQLDAPSALWTEPADVDVAAFLGVGPLVAAEVHDGLATGGFGSLPIDPRVSGRVTVLIPDAALDLAPSADSGRLSAVVVDVRFAGDHHRIDARLLDGSRVSVRTTAPATLPGPGQLLELGVRTAALRAFPTSDAPPA